MAAPICEHCGGFVIEGHPIQVGRLIVLAPPHCRAVLDDAVIPLSDTEARLLYALAQHAPALLDKTDLFDLVWPGPTKPSSRKIVDIVVHNLRDKMGTAVENGRRLLVSEYGKGLGLACGA